MIYDLYESAESLNKEFRVLVNDTNHEFKSLAQLKFESEHPEVLELYPQIKHNHYENMKLHLYFQKIDDIMNNRK